LRETRPTESYLGVTLKELSRLTPGPIRLTGLDYQGTKVEQNLNLQGIVKSRTVPPEVLLAEYVKTLDDSPVFTTVSVSRYTKKEVRDAFELEFSLLLAGIR
jgi:Tfp pilus assembly protein PilN